MSATSVQVCVKITAIANKRSLLCQVQDNTRGRSLLSDGFSREIGRKIQVSSVSIFTVAETHSAFAYQVYASLLVECGSAIRAISLTMNILSPQARGGVLCYVFVN